ncbi:hypothetical protein OG897_08435 [Streptomyces sp. NBC_00237]|uniref:hypothetical protein n=1 Tax=Streptomyces sp. NBC_00237 TaxID=2975687 RepID=UPI00224D6DAD|nr:hypothetical protein [Streptomyces sp. NBC_00237]MCX5201478.1 hypothetical protein [Streptomyces sp. NBC_00237]
MYDGNCRAYLVALKLQRWPEWYLSILGLSVRYGELAKKMEESSANDLRNQALGMRATLLAYLKTDRYRPLNKEDPEKILRSHEAEYLKMYQEDKAEEAREVR